MLKVIQQIGKTHLALLVAFLVVCNMFVLLHAPTTYARTSETTYECGGDVGGHCYGIVDWFGPVNSHLGGVQTDIVVEPIDCDNINPADGSCGGLFLNNEIWMVDDTSSQAQYCPTSSTSMCWVEAGYKFGGTYDQACNYGFSGSQCYFWADNRPNGGYYEHWNILPADNYGHHTRFRIKWLGNGSWDVSINPLASSDGYWDSTSTNNTIYPQNEEMGEELAGATSTASDGLYTPTYADWVNNKWADSNENYHYQTSCVSPQNGGNCSQIAKAPPYEQWVSVPTCCNNGGDFQAFTPQGS